MKCLFFDFESLLYSDDGNNSNDFIVASNSSLQDESTLQ